MRKWLEVQRAILGQLDADFSRRHSLMHNPHEVYTEILFLSPLDL